MKKLFFPLLLLALAACKKNNVETGNDQTKTNLKSVMESKVYFARTLAIAIEKEPILRTFIKKEALKQFDKDYDVFYQLVKNEDVGDGETFSVKISKYASSKDTFDEAVRSVPLLNILIPELPEFDVHRWNASAVVPSVAVAPANDSAKENIKAFYSSDNEYEIPYGLIPSKPTIVVKENERIVVNGQIGLKFNQTMSAGNTNGPKNSNLFLSTDGMSFSFGDDAFNGLNSSNAKNISKATLKDNTLSAVGAEIMAPPSRSERYAYTNRVVPLSSVQHIVTAMQSGAEWPRDNVYYGISSTNPSGPLKRNIYECLTAIHFYDAEQAYNHLTQTPDDPRPVEGSVYQGWTAGSYEFRITVLINSKNGSGPETMKVILVRPAELFEIGYATIQGPCCNPAQGTYFYQPRIAGGRLYTLPEPLKLANWNLENYSYGWKVLFARYNNQSTIVESFVQSSEFATNFELSLTLGETVKIGPKFGSTTKYTNSQTHSYSKVIGPQDFGDAHIDFSNPIWQSYTINGSNVTYNPYELQLGIIYLTIEPRVF